MSTAERKGADLHIVAEEQQEQVLVGFAEGGEAALVGLEHTRGQQQRLHRLT